MSGENEDLPLHMLPRSRDSSLSSDSWREKQWQLYRVELEREQAPWYQNLNQIWVQERHRIQEQQQQQYFQQYQPQQQQNRRRRRRNRQATTTPTPHQQPQGRGRFGPC